MEGNKDKFEDYAQDTLSEFGKAVRTTILIFGGLVVLVVVGMAICAQYGS